MGRRRRSAARRADRQPARSRRIRLQGRPALRRIARPRLCFARAQVADRTGSLPRGSTVGSPVLAAGLCSQRLRSYPAALAGHLVTASGSVSVVWRWLRPAMATAGVRQPTGSTPLCSPDRATRSSARTCKEMAVVDRRSRFPSWPRTSPQPLRPLAHPRFSVSDSCDRACGLSVPPSLTGLAARGRDRSNTSQPTAPAARREACFPATNARDSAGSAGSGCETWPAV